MMLASINGVDCRDLRTKVAQFTRLEGFIIPSKTRDDKE